MPTDRTESPAADYRAATEDIRSGDYDRRKDERDSAGGVGEGGHSAVEAEAASPRVPAPSGRDLARSDVPDPVDEQGYPGLQWLENIVRERQEKASAARINDRDVSYARSHPDGPFQTVELPPGSLVVEKYRYANQRGNEGVQWLAESVDAEGNLLLHRACRTRKEALEVLSRV